MTMKSFVKAVGVVAVFVAVVLAGLSITSPRIRAGEDDRDNNESKIQRGFDIAPVPLNLQGKNRALVGLGSYLVNAVGDCHGCHSAGPPTQFLPGGNPFFGQPKKENPATYLGGGRDFGPLIPGSAHIVSRNLTPDKTGLPEGGHTFSEFVQIIRTDVDMDHLHPTCSGAPLQTACPLRLMALFSKSCHGRRFRI